MPVPDVLPPEAFFIFLSRRFCLRSLEATFLVLLPPLSLFAIGSSIPATDTGAVVILSPRVRYPFHSAAWREAFEPASSNGPITYPMNRGCATPAHSDSTSPRSSQDRTPTRRGATSGRLRSHSVRMKRTAPAPPPRSVRRSHRRTRRISSTRCARLRMRISRGVSPRRFRLRKVHNMSNNLYVGNLTFNTTSADLEALFAQHGEVKKAQVINDRETGRSRGFGFAEMASSEEATAAISALNGHNLDGRDLNVSIAKERSR